MNMKAKLEDLKPCSYFRHDSLPDGVIERIKKLEVILKDVYPRPLQEWIDDFRRDVTVEPELIIWEKMATKYLSRCKTRGARTKKEIFEQVLKESLEEDPLIVSDKDVPAA